MKFIVYSFLTLFTVGCANKVVTTDYTKYVDPLIGSAGHGHVFVGANVPHGMVQLGPTNLSKGWDWCSGYHASDSTIIGFAHTHLSGTGIGDLGDILVTPYVGETPMYKGNFDNLVDGYVSTFNKDSERVEPGYYSVVLDKSGVKVELTASERSGVHQYTFSKDQKAGFIFDLAEGIGWDSVIMSRIEVVERGLQGYRRSTGWAKDQTIYFYAELPQQFDYNVTLYRDTLATDLQKIETQRAKARIEFMTTGQSVVSLKVGISYVSEANARQNLEQEVGFESFEAVRASAKKRWNEELAVVDIQPIDSAQLKTFYTALYHTKFAPTIFTDVNGQYRGADGKVYTSVAPVYTLFSLWDTYRAANPLYTIIEPNRVGDYVNSLLNIYSQQGHLPVWHLAGNETNCMVGYHSAPVIADAALKGFASFDKELALEAMLEYARSDRRGLMYLNERGWIPADKEEWSVAKALEYAIDDWAIARYAQWMGRMDIVNEFMQRSKNYQFYFDSSINFMRGRLDNGNFRPDFDPFHSKHMEDDFVEGNSWQYTFLVPHDVHGLIAMMGGEQQFSAKLDSLFNVTSELPEGASVDISGLIGQFAHGNEPSHHILYMYAYTGEQYKTAQRVRQVLREQYFAAPDGLSGNEDCGQMSSWYIFSTLGFYPVQPAGGVYVLGSPAVKSATISLPDGKQFVVEAVNQSEDNIYIQQATLNGAVYDKSYITHSDITSGGKLIITMGGTPNKSFGVDPENRPLSNGTN